MSSDADTKSDHDLQVAVQDELEWRPEIDVAGVGVAVENGTVTLFGEVDDYAERVAVMDAARQVHGVTEAVDRLTTAEPAPSDLNGAEIAKELRNALTWARSVPENVTASFHRHAVTLTGSVRWNFQREAAGQAVLHLRGVRSVKNKITLTDRPSAIEAEERIQEALTRSALLNAKRIVATVVGNEVTLTGTVHSATEADQARQAAWSSPHVTTVVDQLKVLPA